MTHNIEGAPQGDYPDEVKGSFYDHGGLSRPRVWVGKNAEDIAHWVEGDSGNEVSPVGIDEATDVMNDFLNRLGPPRTYRETMDGLRKVFDDLHNQMSSRQGGDN